jgi:molecular chaperone DnaK
MGHSFAEVSAEQKSFLQSSKGTTIHHVDIDGRLYSQELSAMTLQKMKKTAEDYLGQTVRRQLLLFLLTLMMHNVKLLKSW